MKKLVFITFGLIFSLNLANASDLLFKATNGTLSENSLGVKKLSDEEMKKVLGGYYRVPYLDTNTRTYWLISDSFYASWDNGRIAPTPGTATVRDKMGFSGKNVVILGIRTSFNRLDYLYSFAAYDTVTQRALREFTSGNNYIKSALSSFISYTKSSNAHRF